MAYDASELFVIVRSRTTEPDRKELRVVFVDEEARAVLHEVPGYTRITVSPGPHEVIVVHRMKSYGFALVFPLPVPLHFEMQAKASVNCEARSWCGVAVDEDPPTTWRGFKMSAKSIPEDQLEQAAQGLTFTEPDR